MPRILLKRSNVTGVAPTTSDLVLGELALNTADGTVYMRRSDNTIVQVGVVDGGKGDISVTGNGDVWTIDDNSVTIAKINATGTPSASTFLRGDGQWAAASGGGGVSDGDKGDITVSASGATWSIDSDAVTTSKIADSSVTMAKLSASGTADSSTVLAGSGAWIPSPYGIARAKPLSGMYLSTSNTSSTMSTTTVTANSLRMVPVMYPWDVEIDGIAFAVTTAAASGNGTVGIYASDSDMRPTGAALVSGNSISTSTTGTKLTTDISYTLLKNTLYYFAIHAGGATITVRAYNANSMQPLSNDPAGTTQTNALNFLNQTYASGLPTIPTILSSSYLATNPPAVYVRLA